MVKSEHSKTFARNLELLDASLTDRATKLVVLCLALDGFCLAFILWWQV
jgi:hypothetical protein